MKSTTEVFKILKLHKTLILLAPINFSLTLGWEPLVTRLYYRPEYCKKGSPSVSIRKNVPFMAFKSLFNLTVFCLLRQQFQQCY